MCVGGASTHACMHAADLTSWLKMSDVVQTVEHVGTFTVPGQQI